MTNESIAPFNDASNSTSLKHLKNDNDVDCTCSYYDLYLKWKQDLAVIWIANCLITTVDVWLFWPASHQFIKWTGWFGQQLYT